VAEGFRRARLCQLVGHSRPAWRHPCLPKLSGYWRFCRLSVSQRIADVFGLDLFPTLSAAPT
jgi:hypothetical protein